MASRYGTAWYMRKLDTAPMFLWRDRDSDHPAHLVGATIKAGSQDLIWARFAQKFVNTHFARMSTSWSRYLAVAAKSSVAGPAAIVHPGTVRLLINHSTWFEKMIGLHGRAVQIPQLIISIDDETPLERRKFV